MVHLAVVKLTTMHKVMQILLTLFVLQLCAIEGCQWSIEAEHAIVNPNTAEFNGTIETRSRASNQQTVRLEEGQYIAWMITTDSSCLLQVINVQYTNDGLSDTITVYIDGKMVGFFKTRSRSGEGHLWNEPVSSGKVGNETMLSSGDHTITLIASEVDEYLVEIDKITLALLCTNDISNTEGSCPKSSQGSENDNASNNFWDIKEHIIGLAVGMATVVTAVITLIARIYCLWRNRVQRQQHPQVSIHDDELVL